MRIACIDIGTVTARLALFDIDQDVRLAQPAAKLVRKISTICNLGERVDETGFLTDGACKRVADCVCAYIKEAKNSAAEVLCCTLTSAARDAQNSGELLEHLRSFGIVPQIIPGTTEGALTFFGVAQNFLATPILVADNGGGSTELSCGTYNMHNLELSFVSSTPVGCRRLTEKFLSKSDPVSAEDISFAHEWAKDIFSFEFEQLRICNPAPQKLIICGGTATSLIAMRDKIEPYDSASVHLNTFSLDDIEKMERHLAPLTLAEKGGLIGLQPSRAPVILAGIIALHELLLCGNFSVASVSESDLLMGLALQCGAYAQNKTLPLDWQPKITFLS